MLILSIDCASAFCRVCLWQDGAVLRHISEPMERGQDARLMPLISACMAQSGKTFKELDRIAVTRGPGSFTGLRVGLSAAQGIGLASGKPVIGIDRFSICRSLFQKSGALFVVLHSKRADLFCKFFPAHGVPHDAVLMTSNQIDEFLLEHPDAERAGDLEDPLEQSAIICAELASKADSSNRDFLPVPLYLRAPDVTFAAAKSR